LESLCGFVYLQHEDDGELHGALTADGLVTLHWDRDQPIDLDTLSGVLDRPRVTQWSDISIAEDSHHGLWLRLTATDTRVCRLGVDASVPPQVCDPLPGWWRMALVDDDTLAYLAYRNSDYGKQDTDEPQPRWELGVIGHGPKADQLCEYLCDEIREWAPRRHEMNAILTVYPTRVPGDEPPRGAIDKATNRFVLNVHH
jgi:protein-L-isoaspartate(D-aspartate) O-methyltransferase